MDKGVAGLAESLAGESPPWATPDPSEEETDASEPDTLEPPNAPVNAAE